MEMVTFTRRTGGLKLVWLEAQLSAAGIPHHREGRRMFGDPITKVPADKLDAAWEILDPVDDVDDDDPRFDLDADQPDAKIDAGLADTEDRPRRA